jgi:hypothetical protein
MVRAGLATELFLASLDCSRSFSRKGLRDCLVIRGGLCIIFLSVILLASGCVSPPSKSALEPYSRQYPDERLNGVQRVSCRTFVVLTESKIHPGKGHRFEVVRKGDEWKMTKSSTWRD